MYWGVVTMYSSCVLGCSDYVFKLCTGGVVTMYSSSLLGGAVTMYSRCVLGMYSSCVLEVQ